MAEMLSGGERFLVQFFIDWHQLKAGSVNEKPDVGVLQEFPLTPWQYNSSAPVPNRGSYDLWIEVPALGSNTVVGNGKDPKSSEKSLRGVLGTDAATSGLSRNPEQGDLSFYLCFFCL